MFMYLECLLHWGALKSVKADFLPVGHTHEDIDQAFSKRSNRLRSEKAVILSDFHDILRKKFAGAAEVVYLKKIVNWSELCEHSKMIKVVPPFSQY